MAEDTSKDAEAQIREKSPKIHAFLFGPIEHLQQQLQSASLFIMAFECLKDYVEHRFQEFFATGFEIKNDEFHFILPKKFLHTRKKFEDRYRQLAEKIVGRKPKAVSLFQMAIAWLHDVAAIDDGDLQLMSDCTTMRNDIAHELYKCLLNDATLKGLKKKAAPKKRAVKKVARRRERK